MLIVIHLSTLGQSLISHLGVKQREEVWMIHWKTEVLVQTVHSWTSCGYCTRWVRSWVKKWEARASSNINTSVEKEQCAYRGTGGRGSRCTCSSESRVVNLLSQMRVFLHPVGGGDIMKLSLLQLLMAVVCLWLENSLMIYGQQMEVGFGFKGVINIYRWLKLYKHEMKVSTVQSITHWSKIEILCSLWSVTNSTNNLNEIFFGLTSLWFTW